MYDLSGNVEIFLLVELDNKQLIACIFGRLISTTDHKTRVESQKNSVTVAYFDQRLHENYKLLFLTSNSKHPLTKILVYYIS